MYFSDIVKRMYIPLRNLAVVCLCMVCILFVSEKILKKNKASETVYSRELNQEEFSVRYMNFKKTPSENLKTANLVSTFFSIYQLEEFLDTEQVASYPLIDLNGKKEYPEDAYHIVVIGDSYVWGDGCTNRNELFWRQLEQILEEKGYNCRVYGVGMGAANAYEELSWLTDSDLVENLSPDMVIFGYVENDADSRTGFIVPESIDWKEQLPWLYQLKSSFPNIYSIIKERLSTETLYNQKYGTINYGIDSAILKGEILDQYKNDFVDPLNAFATEADFPIVVMTLPKDPYYYHSYRKLYEPLYKLYREAENIRFYDCLEAFCKFDSKKHAANYAMSTVNSHPGSASHYFYANYIADFLENDFALSEHCGRTEQEEGVVYINDAMPGTMDITEISSAERSAVYRFTYPSENTVHKTEYYEFKDFLYQPIGEDYVKLCFASPVDIATISLSCEAAADVRLYYTKVNEDLGYDDHSVIPVEQDENDGFVCGEDGLRAVTAVCIHADIPGGDAADLVLTVNER